MLIDCWIIVTHQSFFVMSVKLGFLISIGILFSTLKAPIPMWFEFEEGPKRVFAVVAAFCWNVRRNEWIVLLPCWPLSLLRFLLPGLTFEEEVAKPALSATMKGIYGSFDYKSIFSPL
jgi:hypothetical protein